MCQSLFFNKVADLKKETLAQVFSCEFCEISKNIFSYRTPLAAASIFNRNECAKFHGSCATVGLVGLLPRCYCAFVGPKCFLVGISWVQNFFSWVFSGSNIFSCGYFVGPKFFHVYVSWVQNFMTFNKLL